MPTEHNKLVRDRIPEIIAAEGRTCNTEILNDEAYRRALRTKLIEEAHEAAETNSESDLIKELADLFEVAEAVMKANGIDVETVKDKQQERCESRGGFEQRIFLLWTE